MTNIIAGEVQEISDFEFGIGVPIIVKGQIDKVEQLKGLNFSAIPFTWAQRKAYLVVGSAPDD